MINIDTFEPVEIAWQYKRSNALLWSNCSEAAYYEFSDSVEYDVRRLVVLDTALNGRRLT